jgi:purine-nucleoside phosphorylase
MASPFETAGEVLSFLQKICPERPDWCMVLGSGMGHLAEDIKNPTAIPYGEIPHFPVSTVSGHAGRLIFGEWGTKKVVVMQGRFHYYEGYSMAQVTLPVRVFGLWGIKKLLLTNAAGGLNPNQKIGEVMWIADHINMMGTNPLIGTHDEKWGDRFPDMSQVYHRNWHIKALEISKKEGLTSSAGVYMGVSGPTYETPAEYKAFRILGADAVGMSTIPEAIAAHQMGIKILGFSIISDLGVEGKIEMLSHSMVVNEVEKTAEKMRKVVPQILEMD